MQPVSLSIKSGSDLTGHELVDDIDNEKPLYKYNYNTILHCGVCMWLARWNLIRKGSDIAEGQ